MASKKPHTGKNIECLYCNRSFYIPKNRFASAKYCSLKCKGLYERVEITATCGICGHNFTHISSRVNKAKYCSRKCYYKSQRHIGSIKLPCDWCGTIIRKSPSRVFNNNYCSISCRGNGKSTKKQVRKIQKCQRCNWDIQPDILIIHHIDRNKKNNEIPNLELLCWNCHMLEHFNAKDGPYNHCS